MFSTPPHTPNPLVTDIENLACSCFCKIAALFAKLEHFARCCEVSGQLATQSTASVDLPLSNVVSVAENDQLNNPAAMSRKVKGVYEGALCAFSSSHLPRMDPRPIAIRSSLRRRAAVRL
jgi:hypothetical protein